MCVCVCVMHKGGAQHNRLILIFEGMADPCGCLNLSPRQHLRNAVLVQIISVSFFFSNLASSQILETETIGFISKFYGTITEQLLLYFSLLC